MQILPKFGPSQQQTFLLIFIVQIWTMGYLYVENEKQEKIK